MTLREKAIVSLFTDVCMVSNGEVIELYKVASEALKRPIMTHELGSQMVREAVKPMFLELCNGGEHVSKPYLAQIVIQKEGVTMNIKVELKPICDDCPYLKPNVSRYKIEYPDALNDYSRIFSQSLTISCENSGLCGHLRKKIQKELLKDDVP